MLMADCMTKRYLKSYLAASVVLISFEKLLCKILEGEIHGKFDLKHIKSVFTNLQEVITDFYGYNKFVMFQVLGKFLFSR